MKITNRRHIVSFGFAFAIILSGFGIANGQTSTAWGYNTGYGNVYGTYGLAQTMQSMYNVARAQSLKRSQSEGSTAKTAAKGSPSSTIPKAPARVVRNYGRYVPVPALNSGKAFADALGDTPEERALILQIFTATKTEFDKEAAARGWKNNMAAGLSFFTATAITVYHDTEQPSDAAISGYYELINATFDEMPSLKTATNKDKQNFNNMTVGFAGLLLASYVEAKQNNDAAAIANAKTLAGMLIEMVLKTDPENVKIENGMIVIS